MLASNGPRVMLGHQSGIAEANVVPQTGQKPLSPSQLTSIALSWLPNTPAAEPAATSSTEDCSLKRAASVDSLISPDPREAIERGGTRRHPTGPTRPRHAKWNDTQEQVSCSRCMRPITVGTVPASAGSQNVEEPLRIRLPGGITENLSEEEARRLCDALWTFSDLKGSIALLGKLSHESRSPSRLAHLVELDEREVMAFRRALERIREVRTLIPPRH
jgi:hypothetical protein